MACFALDLIVNKLQKLITDEIRGLLMIQSETESLLSELEDLRCVFNCSPQTRDWICELRNLTYELEDFIEEILFEGLKFQLAHQKGWNGTKGWFTKVERYLTGFQLLGSKFVLSIGIRSLTLRIRVVNHGLLAYQGHPSLLSLGQPGQLGASGDSDERIPFADRRNSIDLERFWKYEEDSIVGIQDAKEQVTRLLLEDKEGGKDLKLVAICGMGGIGKTTLASYVYNDDPVRRHFDCFAWASVGASFQTRLVFQDILLSLIFCSRGDLISYSDSELAEKIYITLRGKRYIIVLDDIWDRSAWDCLSLAFPSSGSAGSRVLVTTRALEVAQMTASGSGCIYQMRGLNQHQSLHLLFSTAFRTHSPDPSDVKKITKYAEGIALKCLGLPLAIRVVGGLLASKKQTPDEWMAVCQNFGFYREDSDFLIQVLNLAYDSLPYYLKPCFIYFGIFPKGAKVKTESLLHLWLAEGLIIPDPTGKVSLTDIAEWYLYELCIRSLVSVHKHDIPTGRWFKSCYVHDLNHDLCLSKQVADDFFVSIHFKRAKDGNLDSSSLPFRKSRIRRLALNFNVGRCDTYKKDVTRQHPQSVSNGSALQNHRQSSWKLDDQWNLSRLRVLYVCNSKMLKLPTPNGELIPWHLLSQIALPEARYHLSNLRSLRVLHCSGFNFCAAGINFAKLSFLKCLTLRNCSIKSLPSSICYLPNLETLDLQDCSRTKIVIPVELQKLRSIRYLYLPYQFEVQDDGKLQFNGLMNLEILVNFDSTLCEVKGLHRLTKLEKLVATLSGDLEELAEINNIVRISLNSLLFTSLRVRLSHFSMENQSIENEQLEFRNVQVLRLEGLLGKIPIKIAHSVSKLSLAGSELHEDPMEKLENLANLIVLTFRNNAFLGKCMTCSASGMPRLRHLALLNLDNLKNLAIEEGGMPNLSTLALERCQSLKDLPEGLSSLKRLQDLKFFCMPPEFTVQVNLAREVLLKNKHMHVINK